MTMLEEQLRNLGDRLDLDDRSVVDGVFARLDHAERASRSWRPLQVAAATVLLVAAVVAAVPSSRRAVADWLGFDGVRIERRDDLDVPSTPPPIATASPASGADGTVVGVDGTDVLVSEFVGTLDEPVLTKTLGDGTEVTRVTVGGQPGVWIDGEPHVVAFLGADGEFASERFAGNTLLWQAGSVIRRLEGFDNLAAALAYAEDLGT